MGPRTAAAWPDDDLPQAGDGQIARDRRGDLPIPRPPHCTCRLIEPSPDATLRRRVTTPESCPNCGADVPPRSRACPECGACEETGWSERAQGQRLDLPDEEFDYDEFVGREFGGRPLQRRGPQGLWWVVACLVLLAFLALMLRR